ncbi:M48 family metallopeptidase [Clostridium sp. YIM B02505]|uniref:M48 family metallopeptidase n=1 Tax=Clostridium yunnanense TaxID=2800325 RepID=A0ABS1EQ65_9CLOT|nr:SprT family zinc-dependent metalloprotease [Clostridium yunnanense]MBK1811552.1 M48 family metallopeptidase [Clostridium yunnanense]
MQINISGISIEVQKKDIKNLHLYVKPPNGNVIVSAPLEMSNAAIEVFIRTKLGWIRNQITKYENQARFSERQYVSGETIYIWGKQYYLIFKPSTKNNSFEIQGNKVILSMKAESTVKQREGYVREQFRSILKKEIETFLPKWEQITNLNCECWQTKYMTTRWGTCNNIKKKLWFNLQLVQKPIECLEYVILHELAHLKEKTHGEGFIAIMDNYMPHWREVRKLLNEQTLDYYEPKV